MSPRPDSGATERLRLVVRGAVQGVGFRPFLYRLASELGLGGWVQNTSEGLVAEVEGPGANVRSFLLRLEPECPARAHIQSLEPSFLDPAGHSRFEILPSRIGPIRTLVLPDIATCPACLAELRDPADRRYRYPFINCTHCGPRFTIIERLPYDRLFTSMRRFDLCAACRIEYEDPADRRFHAQPIACPDCGPQLTLLDPGGRRLAERDAALLQTAAAVRDGAIAAVKGLGGFHLIVDATNVEAIRRLRARKNREAKPFALMVSDLDEARGLCRVSSLEARLLAAPEAPIVLLERLADDGSLLGTSDLIAPGNPALGLMLPYTPLHHLLLEAVGRPVVATSGNLSDEPICTDATEALDRLGATADCYLVHDRPIVRHADDSIVRVVMNRELVLRRARGYAPLPVGIPFSKPDSTCTLAVGAHLKNTVAIGREGQAFVSQHIGDLETALAFEAFRRAGDSLSEMLECRPDRVACDLHPDYLATRHARTTGLPVLAVQHHAAHVLACLAENRVACPALGVSWDGTGYGTDGTVWGGEFFAIEEHTCDRVARLRTFPLPGGEAAIREPRRSALGALFAVYGDDGLEMTDLAPLRAFSPTERPVVARMLRRGLHAPATSSAGRLFDAVASLLDLRHESRYEGQAAMELEFAAGRDRRPEPYGFTVVLGENGLGEVDWHPLLREIVRDVRHGEPVGGIAARFHRTLAEIIAAVARARGSERAVLSGGCFQNRLLTEWAVEALESSGVRAYWHQRIPPNDGGISLGQLVAARRSPQL